MSEIKTLPQNTREFTANGKKYIVSDRISPERYKEYEKLAPRLTFGLNFKDIFANLLKAFNLLNKPVPEPLSAGIIIHNVMNGIKGIDDEKRLHPALMMAALVIIREGEDARVYDEQVMLEKIADWQAEGLDMMYFFALSLGSIQGFRETLLKYTAETMTKISEEIQK